MFFTYSLILFEIEKFIEDITYEKLCFLKNLEKTLQKKNLWSFQNI